MLWWFGFLFCFCFVICYRLYFLPEYCIKCRYYNRGFNTISLKCMEKSFGERDLSQPPVTCWVCLNTSNKLIFG